MYKFFMHHKERGICQYIHSKEPKRIYAEDLLTLGEGAIGSPAGVDVSTFMKDQPVGSFVHLLPIACLNCDEVSQIERRGRVIERGMIEGATRVLTLLGPIVGIPPEGIDSALQEMFPLTLRRPSPLLTLKERIRQLLPLPRTKRARQ
jgi:hypothetical protein